MKRAGTVAALLWATALWATALWATAHSAAAQGLDLSKGGAIDVTADNGIELRQNEQKAIARGNARAVRGDVTVDADVLTAFYRRKGGAAAKTATGATPGPDTGSNEVYRLEATGHVRIYTATDLAVGDRAIYDIDQAVLLMTGDAMKITTPQQVMTARDTMEYWSQKHMAVGRGLAVVTTSDGRRLSGDVLVGYTTPPPPAEGAPAAGTTPAGGAAPAQASTQPPISPGTSPITTSGKLQRVEAFGNVEVRTVTETFRGQKAVYVADSEIARLAGNVRVTRGQNQLNGDEAIVNMRTGIYTMTKAPGGRVQGLVIPNDATPAAPKKP